MIRYETLRMEFVDLDEAEVARWIAAAYLRAHGEPGAWAFEEIDAARLRLIVSLTRELAVEEETLPVVLSLVDQLYDLRRKMLKVDAAFSEFPPEVKARLLKLLET